LAAAAGARADPPAANSATDADVPAQREIARGRPRPDQSQATLTAALALVAGGKYRDAERLLEQALARDPDHVGLWLAWIDSALDQELPAVALRRIRRAQAGLHDLPDLHYRAARALFQQGLMLGQAKVCRVPGGRAGQFAGRYLLVESRLGAERFLCCPVESALYQLRLALDGGLDDPRADLLHARIWQRLNRPDVGLAVLKSRAASLATEPRDDVLAALCELAMAAGALPDYLHYSWLRAARHPRRRRELLGEACLAMAESYSRRGDETLYVEWLRRAAQLRPDDRDVLTRAADAEWNAGRKLDACDSYGRLLQRWPDQLDRGRILSRLVECESSRPAP